MSKKLISVLFILVLSVFGCTRNQHFGVTDKAMTMCSPEVTQTEDAIAKAEKSPGAKICPEKIAKAKAIAQEAMNAYWSCDNAKAMKMLADARKLAKEAEGCSAPAPVAPPAPAPAPVAPPARQPISFHSVYFDFDKADLKPAAIAELDRAAKIMQDNPGVVLELQGHTDGKGSAAYNKKLGDKRAQTVFKYLNSKGIKSDRLKAVSFGMDNPTAPNTTDAGRAQNRRVDLVILK